MREWCMISDFFARAIIPTRPEMRLMLPASRGSTKDKARREQMFRKMMLCCPHGCESEPWKAVCAPVAGAWLTWLARAAFLLLHVRDYDVNIGGFAASWSTDLREL